MTDAEREGRISALRWELTEAHRCGDISRARIVWKELRAAVQGRAPHVVEAMEVAKGLR